MTRTGPDNVVWAIHTLFSNVIRFFVPNSCLVGSICVLATRYGLVSVAMTRTDPNDVFWVVWPIRTLFSKVIRFFVLNSCLLGSMCVLATRYGLVSVAMTGTGPNDTFWVVRRLF
jgi:hypothetical protein